MPRVTIFGGKAASAYYMAKKIVRLINRVGMVVNNDPDVKDLLKVRPSTSSLLTYRPFSPPHTPDTISFASDPSPGITM